MWTTCSPSRPVRSTSSRQERFRSNRNAFGQDRSHAEQERLPRRCVDDLLAIEASHPTAHAEQEQQLASIGIADETVATGLPVPNLPLLRRYGDGVLAAEVSPLDEQ